MKSNVYSGAGRSFQRRLGLMSAACGLRSAVCSLRSSVCGLRSLPTAHCPLATGCRGFSLIELMAVMLLMFLMMGIATTAFRGVMRGAGLRGAVATIRGTSVQARQQAMNNGQPVAVLLSQPDDSVGTMRTVMSFGRVNRMDGDVVALENELPWTASEISGSPVYNFRSATSGEIRAGAGAGGSRIEFRVLRLAMNVGDEIAFEVGSLREIPTSLEFDFGSGDFMVIEFNADGSAAADYDFAIAERVGGAGFNVTVRQMTGAITVGDLQ